MTSPTPSMEGGWATSANAPTSAMLRFKSLQPNPSWNHESESRTPTQSQRKHPPIRIPSGPDDLLQLRESHMPRSARGSHTSLADLTHRWSQHRVAYLERARHPKIQRFVKKPIKTLQMGNVFLNLILILFFFFFYSNACRGCPCLWRACQSPLTGCLWPKILWIDSSLPTRWTQIKRPHPDLFRWLVLSLDRPPGSSSLPNPARVLASIPPLSPPGRRHGFIPVARAVATAAAAVVPSTTAAPCHRCHPAPTGIRWPKALEVGSPCRLCRAIFPSQGFPCR